MFLTCMLCVWNVNITSVWEWPVTLILADPTTSCHCHLHIWMSHHGSHHVGKDPFFWTLSIQLWNPPNHSWNKKKSSNKLLNWGLPHPFWHCLKERTFPPKMASKIVWRLTSSSAVRRFNSSWSHSVEDSDLFLILTPFLATASGCLRIGTVLTPWIANVTLIVFLTRTDL